jgi:hypothetical protein
MHTIDCGCIAVPATGGTFYVSLEDHDRISRYTWHIDPSTGYPRRTVTLDGHSHSVYAHRQVMGLSNVQGLFTLIDHIDGNRLHAGRHNLRPASAAQNAANRRKAACKTSRFKGVSWDGRPAHALASGRPQLSRPWKARIKFEFTAYHLGRFATETEAALAYNAAAHRLYGKYARLNSVEPPALAEPLPDVHEDTLERENWETVIAEYEEFERGRLLTDGPGAFLHLKYA